MAANWFVRLFPSFRTLESEAAQLREALADLSQEKLRMQDRLDAALEDRGRLWDLVQESIRGERASYQMHVNLTMQRQGGGVPYPDAPHLPPSAAPKEPTHDSMGRRRTLPSEAIARQTSEFVNALFKG